MAPMSTTTPATVPVAGSPDLMARLRGALHSAGYTTEALRGLLRARGELGLRPLEVQVYERRTRDGSRLATVVRLFALGLAVREDDAASAFEPITLAELVDLGLVTVRAGQVLPLVRLVVHGDFAIAHDLIEVGGANHVPGISGPPTLLAGLAVRRPVERMLDLGAGNGIQGLLAARHSRHVVCTDINPRALAYTKFNAALNGVGNLETRLGSLYEPVVGERFGLILANPPYVISPESRLVYRDSGRRPGELCRDVVRGAGPHLDADGYAQVLVSWPMASERRWDEPLRAWLPSDVDAWLLHYQTEDQLTHAAKWNQSFDDAGIREREQILDDWVRYYQQEGIDAIGFGAIFLHRRPGAGRVFVSEGRSGVAGAGHQVQRVFAAIATGELSDEQLIGTVFRPVLEMRLEQIAQPGPDGTWALGQCVARLTEGVGCEGTLDSTLATVLSSMDGNVTLDAAVAAAADQLGVDRDELLAPAVAMARGLYELGFLDRQIS